MVSKVSVKLKANMASKAMGILEASLNSPGMPLIESGANRFSQISERSAQVIVAEKPRYLGYAHGNAYNRSGDYADKYRAPDLEKKKHYGNYQTDDRKNGHGRGEIGDGGNGAGVSEYRSEAFRPMAGIKRKCHHVGVLKPYVSNKYADTAADGVLQALGNGFYYVFPYLGYGNYDVYDTADEYQSKRFFPRKTETEANRKGEECVKSHAGSLSIRNIGE